MIQEILIQGAVCGAILVLLALVLSRLTKDIVVRTLLATMLFAAAGAYLGFAFRLGLTSIWVLIELLQCVAFGTLGLYGWRGSARWLALAWALHPVWDFPLHYLGPGRIYAPTNYVIFCISFDWVVAAYIFIYYRREI